MLITADLPVTAGLLVKAAMPVTAGAGQSQHAVHSRPAEPFGHTIAMHTEEATCINAREKYSHAEAASRRHRWAVQNWLFSSLY